MYLPWVGYFEQVAAVDHFVLMDDVQYTKRDWRNRNRIKTANGALWLTVPVRHPDLDSLIKEVDIDYRRDWVRKHLRSIEVNYHRRPHFRPLFDEIAETLDQRPQRLVDLNVSLIRLFMKHLGIQTPLSLSSAIPRDQRRYGDAVDARNERIIEICQHHRADVLYDGKSAADFIDRARFAAAGIRVVFQDYRPVPYPQAFGEFMPSLSTLDLVMNVGPAAGEIMRQGSSARLQEAQASSEGR
ncbi:MAG: WbqC family protein [Pseudomonadales bacterium]